MILPMQITFRNMKPSESVETRIREEVAKLHEARPVGRIIKLVPDEDYGLLETADGRETYFHRDSVLNRAFESFEDWSEGQLH